VPLGIEEWYQEAMAVGVTPYPVWFGVRPQATRIAKNFSRVADWARSFAADEADAEGEG
jgi:hypothetical protein